MFILFGKGKPKHKTTVTRGVRYLTPRYGLEHTAEFATSHSSLIIDNTYN